VRKLRQGCSVIPEKGVGSRYPRTRCRYRRRLDTRVLSRSPRSCCESCGGNQSEQKLMEPRAHHVLIGAFTVLVAILAVLFSLWLSKAGQHAGERHYVVIFHEAVRGLTVGSAVQYNGIKVGEVMDLSLNPQDPSEVRARIKVQDDIPIKEDTRARLVLTGITGASVIGLS